MRFPALTISAAVAVTLCCGGVAQGQASAVHVAGTWNVHIEHDTGRIVDEQWVLQQEGAAVRGTVLVRDQKYPIDGKVEGNKINFRVTVTTANGPRYNVFLGTITEHRIAGEIKKDNDDGKFSAVRATE
jgi:hypothetical protein